MQLKAEEFCILITRTEPLLLASLLHSGGEDRMCMYVRIYVYIYIYMCNLGFSRRDFDLQAGEYFIIGSIMQRFGISSEGEDLRERRRREGGYVKME